MNEMDRHQTKALGLFQEKRCWGGGGTELENGGTTNTILSFFYGTIHMDIPGNTPHPPNFN